MSAVDSAEVTAAYRYCRQVAKREAKNFYYAFRVLPRHKSDAMCAVYAFMRKADDIADDESFSMEQRRAMMAEWTDAWKASQETASADPVFVALHDTQQRFGISSELLQQLVSGTTLDLYVSEVGVEQIRVYVSGVSENREQTFQAYSTFNDLYRYCYLVASVVGLVCIRIFGYQNPQAEYLAERVGIAFQLTNILRDVAEDAVRGRIYLPLDDLGEMHVEAGALVAAIENRNPSQDVIGVLRKEIERAEDYYSSVAALVPLLDADSRVAMAVLAAIYHELLKKIAADPTAVFRGRISIPTSRKLLILVRGLLRARLMRGTA